MLARPAASATSSTDAAASFASAATSSKSPTRPPAIAHPRSEGVSGRYQPPAAAGAELRGRAPDRGLRICEPRQPAAPRPAPADGLGPQAPVLEGREPD